MGIDLVQYEIFRHRLFNVLEEGRIAIRQVSGSPVVVEGGETLCSFHMANGDPILTAAGILLHLTGCRDFIYKALEWYSEDPGINEGDQLFFNDPYIGGQHSCDQVILKPIFYGGQLVAWTGSCMHTPETGAIEPGGMPASATEIFHEGFRAQGFKIVERNKFRPEIFRFITAAGRDPSLLGLDTKAKLAANNVCEKAFIQLIDKYGLDFINEACQLLVEEGETLARAKLRKLPDGQWISQLWGDCTGLEEKPFKVVCCMTKEADTITFDYTGSSPQNVGPINSALPGTRGSLFSLLCSHLFWDVPWNSGMVRPVTLIAPEGTVVNCNFPSACSQAPPTLGALIIESALSCISKMFIAAGDAFEEDINAPWSGNGQHPYFGGINQYGNSFSGAILDVCANGCGATPHNDGVDSGAFVYAPQSTISDVENIELNIPMMYLARRNSMDSGGFGKYRGGNSYEALYMVYGTEQMVLGGLGTGRRTSTTSGLFGGYPPARSESRMVLNSNVEQWFKQSKSPQTLDDLASLEGDLSDLPASYPARPVKTFDLLMVTGSGGGGYGDPLDRLPSLVEQDVLALGTSLEAAEKVYGVVIDPVTLKISPEATKKKRAELRAERVRGAVVPDVAQGRGRGLTRIHEYLEVATDKTVHCIKCGHEFGSVAENYKDKCVRKVTNPADLPRRTDNPAIEIFQEFYCPGCATLLAVDATPPNEPVLWDTRVKL